MAFGSGRRRCRRHLRKQDPTLRRLIGLRRTVHAEGRSRSLRHAGPLDHLAADFGESRPVDRKTAGRARCARRITPHTLAMRSVAELRSAGVSPQKAGYLHDLAAKVDSGVVRLRQTGRMTRRGGDRRTGAGRRDRRLDGTDVPDVFAGSAGRLSPRRPGDSLGPQEPVRPSRDLPDQATSHRIAKPWRPYATIASWYCWRSR